MSAFKYKIKHMLRRFGVFVQRVRRGYPAIPFGYSGAVSWYQNGMKATLRWPATACDFEVYQVLDFVRAGLDDPETPIPLRYEGAWFPDMRLELTHAR